MNSLESDPSFEQNAELKVHRIYTKSSLFESASLTYTDPLQPTIDLQIGVNIYPQIHPMQGQEAVLTLQVTAKHNGSLLFRCQLQQAGFYTLTGFTSEGEASVLNGFCMQQLYPYACAEISRLANQGGFGPLYLQPINFEQRYRQQQLSEKQVASPLVS